ncbi:MAG: PAS domain S-box protein [Chloroflexi bacterium AL-W]|nr:PAS domain S-box protein [Chloroflexi bacterium AL-N1]NOK68836.1 PAS domain S-box protein [Chloroflexi bacterium AL-N10]NOK76820.1 PAS domain S-box protein [Chloroflexi bacterium AL-N5]NOK82793.1 PAS domain S-box protein [Chloroflexi bacterium AL-W]NOK90677.1 PAS domain S-box protein [Chloroflexi bacterium AL-N15]
MSTYQKMLIADDEPDIRELLRLFFEQQKFAVTLAIDGLDAVAKAHDVNPDIMLLDIQMPRATGIDVVQMLRNEEQFKHTPIIAITAFARKYSNADLAEVGFNRVASKPIDFTQLQMLVQKLLQLQIT